MRISVLCFVLFNVAYAQPQPAGPTAVPVASARVAECNQVVRFEGHRSFAGPGRQLVRYAWDFDGDGQADSDQASLDHPMASLPNEDGDIVARLTVTDDLGAQHSATVSVSIFDTPRPPRPSLREMYTTVQDGAFTPVILDARSSTDSNLPCDRIVRYAWDLDRDGLFGVDDPDGWGPDGRDLEGPFHIWTPRDRRGVGLRACDTTGLCGDTLAGFVVADPLPPVWWMQPQDMPMCGLEEIHIEVYWPGHIEAEVEAVIEVEPPMAPEFEAVKQVIARGLGVLVEGRGEVILRPLDPPVELADGQQFYQFRFIGGPEDRPMDYGALVTIDTHPPTIEFSGGNGCTYVSPVALQYRSLVLDNLDMQPRSEEHPAPGCDRQTQTIATDHCGNESSARGPLRLDAWPNIELAVPAQPAVAPRVDWSIDLPEGCFANHHATLQRMGEAASPFDGGVVERPGQYRLRVELARCHEAPMVAEADFVVIEPPAPDAGAMDASPVADTAVADTAVADTAVADTAVADAAVADGQPADSTSDASPRPDARPTDARLSDARPTDASAPEAERTLATDDGCHTAPGQPGGHFLWVVGLLVVYRRRA